MSGEGNRVRYRLNTPRRRCRERTRIDRVRWRRLGTIAGLEDNGRAERARSGAVDGTDGAVGAGRASSVGDRAVPVVADAVQRDGLNRRRVLHADRVAELATRLRQRARGSGRHVLRSHEFPRLDGDRDLELVVTDALRLRVRVGVIRVAIQAARRALIAVPGRAIGQVKEAVAVGVRA